jgi:fibro-slime domain-containing protein
MKRAVTTALALSIAAAAGFAPGSKGAGTGRGKTVSNGRYSVDVPEYAADDPFGHLPETITLIGTVRDFRERQVPGGHPDFELRPGDGFGHYVGMVQDELDADGKPVFRSKGKRVIREATDAAGRPIIGPKPYIDSRPGDADPILSNRSGDALTGPERFAQWFRDVPGVNMRDAFPISLVREPGTDRYVFDDRLQTHFVRAEGFFAVNDALFGNSKGGNKNFHFTYELQTEFVYREGSGQIFTFSGDDDVWVFIDRKLVIDIGGVHTPMEQTIDLDRLGWLEDGRTYTLHFFFAERHRTESNFRIETSLRLRALDLPTSAALYD